MEEILLGQRVRFKSYLKRKSIITDGKKYKSWISVDMAISIGVIIGRRKLSDGWSLYEGSDVNNMIGHYVFSPVSSYYVYLVAYSMHRNPVYVMEFEFINY